MTDPRLRDATPDDATAIATLGARVFLETFAPFNTPENMRAYLAASFTTDRLRDEIADPASIHVIADVDRNAVGFAHLRAGVAPPAVEARHPIELVRLYVASEQHGRGVAQALLQRCVDIAREGGRDVIHLGVWENNPRAQAFYEKCGFSRVGELVFMLGDDAQTDWLMTRAV